MAEGTYVSSLDRPWLETPFIFQGFEIREQAEIDMLQRYCSVVNIDAEKGQLSDDRVRRLVQMQRKSGKAFAAEVVEVVEVVEQFLAAMGMFPVASLVELNDGSVAVVL